MMIIEPPYKVNDIVSMKLVTGEEVIGKLLEDTNDSIRLGKPFMLMKSQQGPALAPFLLSVDPNTSEAKMDKMHIIALFKTQQETARSYIEHTTGIVT